MFKILTAALGLVIFSNFSFAGEFTITTVAGAYRSLGLKRRFDIPEFTQKAILADGWLRRGDAKKFEVLFREHPEIQIVVVRDMGGSTRDALEIAELIESRKLPVWVANECWSSCAAYLFLAGSKRIVDGVVGYHGNETALNTVGNEAAMKEVKPEDVARMEAARDAFLHGGQMTREQDFLRRRGISQELFDKVQIRPDENGDTFAVVLSEKTETYYGFRNTVHLNHPEHGHGKTFIFGAEDPLLLEVW